MKQIENIADKCFKAGELSSIQEALIGLEDKTPAIDHVIGILDVEVEKLKAEARDIAERILGELDDDRVQAEMYEQAF